MNIVYINTHDTGRILSPYGYDVPTPNLKKLAEDSTLFTHAFCAAPTCSPSRAALLTGVYPHQCGMLGLAQRGFELRDPSKHLAAHLSQSGYSTAISGIQHEAGWYLDLDVVSVNQLGYHNVLTTDSKSFKNEDLHLWDRENAIAAINWMNQLDKNEPFLLSYGLHSTHRPYPIEIAENIDARYVKPAFPGESNEKNRLDQAQYMTTVQYADENIELLIDALKRNGMYNNTLIIYTTDHGVALPYHKCNLKDTGIGVALIMRNPLADVQGNVIDHLVSHLDLFPTICEILQVEKPTYLEGVSFASCFHENLIAHRTSIFAEINFHTSYEPARCVRTQRYKYIKYFDETWKLSNLSNMDESKPKDFLIEHGMREMEKDIECLYDLYFDPYEQNNLIVDSKHQTILHELKQIMKTIMLKTEDPILLGELEFMPQYKVNKKHCVMASSNNPDDFDERGKGV